MAFLRTDGLIQASDGTVLDPYFPAPIKYLRELHALLVPASRPFGSGSGGGGRGSQGPQGAQGSGGGACPINVGDFPGVDLGAKLQNAIASLPAGGGVLDCRCMTGAQTINSKITIDKPVEIIFGASVIMVADALPVAFEFALAAQGSFVHGARRATRFVKSATGAGTIFLLGPLNSADVQLAEMSIGFGKADAANIGVDVSGFSFRWVLSDLFITGVSAGHLGTGIRTNDALIGRISRCYVNFFEFGIDHQNGITSGPNANIIEDCTIEENRVNIRTNNSTVINIVGNTLQTPDDYNLQVVFGTVNSVGNHYEVNNVTAYSVWIQGNGYCSFHGDYASGMTTFHDFRLTAGNSQAFAFGCFLNTGVTTEHVSATFYRTGGYITGGHTGTGHFVQFDPNINAEAIEDGLDNTRRVFLGFQSIAQRQKTPGRDVIYYFQDASTPPVVKGSLGWFGSAAHPNQIFGIVNNDSDYMAFFSDFHAAFNLFGNRRFYFIDPALDGFMWRRTQYAGNPNFSTLGPQETRVHKNQALEENRLWTNNGAFARGSLILLGQPAVADTFTIDTKTYEFTAGGPVAPGNIAVTIGATAQDTSENLQAAINANKPVIAVTANVKDPLESEIYLTADVVGPGGNAAALSKSGANLAVSGATLTGGADEQLLCSEPLTPSYDLPYTDFTRHSNAAGGAETDLAAYTLPAGLLDNDGDCLEIFMSIAFPATGNIKTVNVYVGAALLVSGLSIAAGFAGFIHLNIRVARLGLNSQFARVTGNVGNAATFYFCVENESDPAQNLGANVTIKATGASAALNDVVQTELTVRRFK